MLLLSHQFDSKTPTYGNRDYFSITETSQIKEGDSANSSKWIFSTNHIGTHIDAPNHFFENGKTITDFSDNFWYSKNCFLIDIACHDAKLIEYSDVFQKVPKNTEVLLIRTGYEKYRSKDKYWNDNPGISSKLGEYLKINFSSLRMIGFDFISLTSWKHREEGKLSHKSFLGEDQEKPPICIIEDMALSKIKNKINDILISPIFVRGANGSPVTVFANINE